jgi:predicted dehydrogenase
LPRIKVGVIGCGAIAQEVHIPNYVQNPKSKLAAICDVDQKILDGIAIKYRVEHTFNDYRQLLKSGLIEAASVCVPTPLHSEVVINAAKCGVHVLCEKPLATSIHEADEMLEAVSRGGIKLMVGFNRRFLPNHVKTREYVERGKIGKPILARAQMILAGPYGDEVETGLYAKEAEKRIGCLLDSGSHLADLLIWMFGKPSQVSAYTSTYMDGISVDDLAIMSVKFQNGVLGSISVAWLNLPDYQAVDDSRRIEIIGTKGKIESDGLGPSLYFYSTDSLTSRLRGRIKITPRFDPKNPGEALSWSYRQEIDDFLTSVIRNREPTVSGEQAREALRLILAAYESAKTKSVVSI